jgi:hypothetical protein
MTFTRYIYAFICAGFFLSACEKETTKNVSRTLRVPTIDVNGDEVISLPVGSTYTDEGATYTGEDGSEKPLTATTNEVNTSAPGLFFIDYEETSESGIFETSGHRVVGVTYQDNPTDYSGTYLRTATGISAFVSKVGPGLYRVQNPGGSAGQEGVVVYFIETAANVFEGPEQPNELIGDVEIQTISFTDTGSTWKVINPGYGAGLRTFVKQ